MGSRVCAPAVALGSWLCAGPGSSPRSEAPEPETGVESGGSASFLEAVASRVEMSEAYAIGSDGVFTALDFESLASLERVLLPAEVSGWN